MIHVATEPVSSGQVWSALEREGFVPAYDAPATGSSKSNDWVRGGDRVAFSSDLGSGLAFFVTIGPEQEALGALVRRIVPCVSVSEQVDRDLEASSGSEQVRGLFRLAELGRYLSLDETIPKEKIVEGLSRGLGTDEGFVHGAALELSLNLMWPELEQPLLALAAREPELEWVGEYWQRIQAETQAADAKQRSKAERQALLESLTSLVDEERWDEALSAAERALEADDPPVNAFRALALALRGLGRSWEAALWSAVWFGKAESAEARECLDALTAVWPNEVPELAPSLRQAWARVTDHEPLSRGFEALLAGIGSGARAVELEAFLAALAVRKSYDRPTQKATLPRLESLRQRFPAVHELWLLTALARASAEDLAGAEAAYRSALALVSGGATTHDAAIAAATTAMQEAPEVDTPESIWSSLRWMYSSQSDYENLYRITQQQLEEPGTPDPTVLKDAGLAATFTQRHAEAIQNYRAAIDAGYPDDNGLCHFNLACELARQGEKEPALAALAVAIQRDEEFAERARNDDYFAPIWAQREFRLLVAGLKQAPEVEDVERAISHSLGYQMRGEGDQAIERAEFAVAGAELIGDDRLRARALRQLGQVQTYHASPARGRAVLEEAVTLGDVVFAEEPLERARTLHSLGQCQHAAGDFAAAKSSYEAALELRRAAQGEVDFEVAITYGDLARVAGDRGDRAELLALQERTSDTLRAVLETQEGDDRLDTLLNLGFNEGNRASSALSAGEPAEVVIERSEVATQFLEDLSAADGRVPASALLRLRKVIAEAAGNAPELGERAFEVAHRLFVLEFPDPLVRQHKLYWNRLRGAAFELLNLGAQETEIAAAIARAVRGDEPGEPIASHPAFANLGVEFSQRLTGATDLVMVAMSLDLATRGAQTVDELLDNLEAFALSNIEG
ncbi:MAG: hypothetical protein AB7S68_29930 [Polyangiaceae bacterium]